ncbi:unnamed protein product [Tuber melanosporum]|uniref:(Perigord truffle) hypothetical protein n=1 Tax=Tuber melanosporum (strain Mel28) TaxID=656061 RepID=D5G8Z4_TUBMM|nr:uncharacterized protein GSTUM_00004908001 [Tuber melanosporum]CAZ80987.1 unnamed protein product [Tuber melanosporum]
MFFPLFLMLALVATQAVASLLRPNSVRLSDYHLTEIINRDILKPALENDDLPTAPKRYVELPLNHGDPKSPKFKNRYWVDDTYYSPGGPIFFVDNGEADADGMEEYLRKGATGSLAKEFNGLLILWEHRFYGTSMPDMTNAMRFTSDNFGAYLKYHTIEQALEDVVVFAKQFTFNNKTVSPGEVPWVYLGGSYPGARSAWMRIRNPDIFHVSLASSAVVQLQKNMWQYYRVIEETLDKTGYANCSRDIRNITKWVDNAFDDQNGPAVDQFLEKITGPENSDLWNFFHFDDSSDPGEIWDNRRMNVKAAIGVVYRDFQYVGMNGILRTFCDGLQSNSGDSAGVGADFRNARGIFETHNTSAAIDIYTSVLAALWPKVLKPTDYPADGVKMDQVYNVNCARNQGLCKQIVTKWSWIYQTCIEFGAYQTANISRPTNLLPKFETIENELRDCKGWFGNAVAGGPNLDPINKKYGGWNMNPSNVFWTDGEIDPWRALTPNSIEDGAPKRPSTTNIPPSGSNAGGDTFFGFVMKGGSHCADLGQYVGQGLRNRTGAAPDTTGIKVPAGYVPEADTAHNLFKDALRTWLPAFKAHALSRESSFKVDTTGSSSSGDGGSGGEGSAGGGGNRPSSGGGDKSLAISLSASRCFYSAVVVVVVCAML